MQAVKHAAYSIHKLPVIDWVEATDLEDAMKETDEAKYQDVYKRQYISTAYSPARTNNMILKRHIECDFD